MTIFKYLMGGWIALGFGCHIGDIINELPLLPASIVVIAALTGLFVFVGSFNESSRSK